MNEEIDVGEIIRLAQTEFNLSFSFDVSRMQNLFEQLCINIQKLQNDLASLKKEINNKADKTQLEPLNNEIIHNDENFNNLKDKFDKLKDFCTEKLGDTPKSPKLEMVELKSKESNPFQTSPFQSNPLPSGNCDDFGERIAKCEDKIADFDKRFDEISKFLLSDLPNNKGKGNINNGPTRHERLQGFLDEFDNLYNNDAPATDSPEENNEKDNEKEISNEKEDEQEIKSNPETKISHSNDTLDTFLDAAKIEIENVKKLLSDEFGQQMKENNMKLNSSIAKAAADSEVGLKKANCRLIDTEAKLDSEIKEISNENKNQFQQLRENLELLTNKVKTLESRLDANQKASEMTKDSLKKLVTDDGKIDPEQLLEQMEQHLNIINDIDGRLVAVENREYVSPDSFNTAVKNLMECTEKVKTAETMLISTDMRTTELKESLDEIKKAIEKQVTQDQLNDVEKISHDLQDESSNLRDAIIKSNKDIVSLRAAINTLRGNSEETRSIAEDAFNAVKHASEDVQNNEKQLKKMVPFLKTEIGHIDTQIKELINITERHDETITELQRNHESDIARLEALIEEDSEEESEEDGTPRPKPSKNKQQSQSVPTVSAATSPHLPSLSCSYEPTSNDNQLPPPPPVPLIQSQQQQQLQQMQQQMQQLQQQLQLQSQNTSYTQQPMITVVRRQADVASSKKSNGSSALPRLAQQQAKREIEALRMDMKRYDDLIPRVDRLESTFTALKTSFDSVTKQVKSLTESKADRAELQNLFEQFRMALGELNNRVGGIRKTVASKADLTELKEVQKALIKELVQSGETAAGTETVRCLMCGQPRTNVTGAIDDPTLAKAIGNPVSSRVCGADGQGNVCFVYGEHGEMYMGRSVDGRPIYSRQLNSEEDGGGRGSNNACNGNKPPMTAPNVSRKVLDAPVQNSQ